MKSDTTIAETSDSTFPAQNPPLDAILSHFHIPTDYHNTSTSLRRLFRKDDIDGGKFGLKTSREENIS
jgi:hypothetical protein